MPAKNLIKMKSTSQHLQFLKEAYLLQIGENRQIPFVIQNINKTEDKSTCSSFVKCCNGTIDTKVIIGVKWKQV